MPKLIAFLARRNVADTPGGRKIHTRYTPSLGGVAVYLSFACCMLVGGLAGILPVSYPLLLLLSILFVMGVVDDLLPVRAVYKLFVQIAVALLFCLWAEERITAVYGLWELPLWMQYPLTVFVMVGITNAYNLSDGIDGLAGSIAVAALAFLVYWFQGIGDPLWMLMCLSMLAALVGFLAFNWNPAKIFLGDTGSLVVGFFLAAALVHLMEHNHRLPLGHPWKHTSTIALGMSLVAYPLFDTARIFYLRMRQGRSPFSPDKRHLHHLILRSGYSHRKIAMSVLLFSITAQSTVVLLGLTAWKWLPLLGLLTVCALFFYWVRSRLYRFLQQRPAPAHAHPVIPERRPLADKVLA